MTISNLAEPHVHQCVSGLANFPHVQLSSAWCHQSWCHASWVRCVQAAQLQETRNNDKAMEHYIEMRIWLQDREKLVKRGSSHTTFLSLLWITPVEVHAVRTIRLCCKNEPCEMNCVCIIKKRSIFNICTV